MELLELEENSAVFVNVNQNEINPVVRFDIVTVKRTTFVNCQAFKVNIHKTNPMNPLLR